jgi:hypothetical protein
VQQIKAAQMLLAPDQFIVFLILKLAAKYEVKLKKWGGSQVRGLPLKEAKILSEKHKAVLLVVIGHRRKKGVSKARVGEILGLDASSRENPRVLGCSQFGPRQCLVSWKILSSVNCHQCGTWDAGSPPPPDENITCLSVCRAIIRFSLVGNTQAVTFEAGVDRHGPWRSLPAASTSRPSHTA